MATWFRRRRTPEDRAPATPPRVAGIPQVEEEVARWFGVAPHLLMQAEKQGVPAVRPHWRGGRAVDHDGRLPFGVAVYPDTSTLCQPWFGGPTPAPQRIIPGRQAIDEAGES